MLHLHDILNGGKLAINGEVNNGNGASGQTFVLHLQSCRTTSTGMSTAATGLGDSHLVHQHDIVDGAMHARTALDGELDDGSEASSPTTSSTVACQHMLALDEEDA
jgi:hypothetical protein